MEADPSFKASAQVLFCRKPIAELADLKGLKVRSFSPSLNDLFNAIEVVERTLAAFEIFTGVMAIYFILCFPLSLISSRLERTLSVSSSRGES